MMKSKFPVRVCAAMLVVGMMIGAALAAGSDVVKMLEAHYTGIRFVIDGVETTLKDPNGNVVDPFIVDGTTYAPFRPIAEALGKDVTWEGETKTIYIGKVPGQAENWMTKLPPYLLEKATVYDGSDPKKSFTVAGNKYTNGVLLHFGYNGYPGYAVWNTNGQYKTMTLTVGYAGDNKNNVNMEVYLDGVYSTEYELKYDAAPRTITIPLDYAPNVKLNFVRTSGLYDTYYGIYDISFN